MVFLSSSFFSSIIRRAATNDNWCFILTINSSFRKGLDIKSPTPSLKPLTMLWVSSKAVMKIIGISQRNSSDFRRSATSNPSIPGIITSSNIKSGFSFRITSKASCPLFATRMPYPSLPSKAFNKSTLV